MAKQSNPVSVQRDYLLETLRTCVDEVFETMVTSFKAAAVAEIDPTPPRDNSLIRFRDEGDDPKSIDVDQQVTISFSGDSRGQVVLRCSLDGADHIARGLLMMDEGEVLDVAAVRDALGECANMLAGSLKTKALDPLGSFQLGLPNFAEVPGGEMSGALVYRVADGIISLEIWLG